jgi:hypothetical protein
MTHIGGPRSPLPPAPTPRGRLSWGLTTLLLAGAVGIAAAQSASPCVPGADHPYSDLPGMPLSLPTSLSSDYGGACGALCAANPLCDMFAVVATGCNGATFPQCFLKAGPPVPQPAAACVCFGTANHTAGPSPSPPAPGPAVFNLTTSAGLVAGLGANGLVSLVVGAVAVGVEVDTWVVAVDGVVFNSSSLPTPTSSQDPTTGELVVSALARDVSPLHAGMAVSVPPSVRVRVVARRPALGPAPPPPLLSPAVSAT